jgi:autotransporter-associated beta strand protein
VTAALLEQRPQQALREMPRFLRWISALMVVAFTLAGFPVRAAVLYWDSDGVFLNNVLNQAGTGTGGAGTLDLSLPLWWNGLSANQSWNNSANDTAVFGGTAGTVTLGTGVNLTVGGLQFNTPSYVLNLGANTLTFGGANNTVTLNSLAQANATTAVGATITGAVAGTGNVTLSGGLAAGLVANTLTLNGTSTTGWSGATTIGVGQTLSLGGLSQALVSTSGITLAGGGLTLVNTTTAGEAALNRVNNAAGITSRGGAITFTNTASASVNYAETLGALTLESGLLTVTNTAANTSPSTQTLTFSGLTRSGATNTSMVNFTGTGLGSNAQSRMIFSAGVAVGDIGPWAIYGGNSFAAYDATNGVLGSTTTALAVASNSATTNFNSNAGNITVTASTNPSYKTLQINSGTARVVTATSNTVSLGGVVSSGQNHSLTGGNLQALTAGSPLYVYVGANQLSIGSVIQNVGGGATASTLVFGGAGTLILSGTNTYTGGTVINGGSLQVASVPASGSSAIGTGGVTVNGSGTIQMNQATSQAFARDITLANGAIMTLNPTSNTASINQTFSGNITGTGGVAVTSANATNAIVLSGTNTFTGPIQITSGTLTAPTAASLGNSQNPVNLANTAGVTLNLSGSGLTYTVGSISGAGTTGGTITLGNNFLTFGGNNESTTYAGTMTGTGSIVKVGTGTTTLTGTNTYTGAPSLMGGLVSIAALTN